VVRRSSRALTPLTGLLLGALFIACDARADDAPLVDRDKRVTIGLQPVSALFTQRFSIDTSTLVSEHSSLVVTPYWVYFTTLDYLAILRGDRLQTKDSLEGQGIEFGYRYRTVPVTHSSIAVARFYGDARLFASEFTLREDTQGTGGVRGKPVPYSRNGFAFEFGAEATVSPIFYFSLTGGFEYAYTSRSFDGAHKLDATSAIYGEGFRPRIGGATGFSF
jgi:hypothetical protein